MPYAVFEPMRAAYEHRPFQGKVPEDAKIFFFGIDANYDANIAEEFLNILRQYHENGVAYWLDNWQNNNNNNHHPFLRPEYGQGAGYVYHSTFRMMNLPANLCAEAISFVELLNVPTIGKRDEDPNNLFEQLLQNSLEHGHIERLQNSIFNGQNKLVFMPNEVIENLRRINGQTGLFHGLNYAFMKACGLPVIYSNPDSNVTVRKNLHFSARFHRTEVLAQLPVIKQSILDFLAGL